MKKTNGKNKWFLNGGRGSGRTIRLLCETYENKIADLQHRLDNVQGFLDHDIEYDMDKTIQEQKVKIAELEHKLEQTEKDLADYQFNYPTIKELQKENAELKEKLNIRSCQNCKRNNRTCPNDGSCKHYSNWEGYENPQLTNAKEIIKEFLSYYHSNNYPYQMLEILGKAEQFLKETE